MHMDRTTNCECSGKEAKRESVKANGCSSDQSESASKRKAQRKIRFRLSAVEWLGIAIVALATFWCCDPLPDDPEEWFSWLFDTTWEMEMLLFLIFILVTRAVWKYKRQPLRNFFPGAVEVRGVSIVELSPGSIARNAGMHKGDVIIEYAAARDLTVEILSDIMAETPAKHGLVRVVFMRDRQRYSETLPWGPLGISAINTTISVPLKSD
jgi:hypothetical protein